MWFGAVTLIARSAAVRSLTGLVNVTITGWATPTTAPFAGWIDATSAVGFGGAIAAMLGAPDPPMASTATAAASHTFRIAVRTVSTLRDGASPKRLHSVSLICTLSGAQQTDRETRGTRSVQRKIRQPTCSAPQTRP